MKINFLKTFRLILTCFLLLPGLFACHQTAQVNNTLSQNNQTSSLDKKLDVDLEQKKSNIPFKVEDRQYSPDKRLSVAWYFIDDSNKKYRITVIDREQKKAIFSREITLKDSSHKENTKLVSFIKVLNQLVLVKEESSSHKSYYALNPDKAKIWTLKCPDFVVDGYEISDFGEKGYKCEGLLKATNKFHTSLTKPFPEFIRPISNNISLEKAQIIEKENIKVELSPFQFSKLQTTFGQRSSLKYFKDGKLIYTKFFSGKCTGCQWINQENWKEAFRVEQVLEDQILLTQVLLEVDENGETLPGEPIHTSILLRPSKDKLLHLHCNEKDNEIAYVSEITNSFYKCKYLIDGKTFFRSKKLPK